jgi:hypothetical protein
MKSPVWSMGFTVCLSIRLLILSTQQYGIDEYDGGDAIYGRTI